MPTCLFFDVPFSERGGKTRVAESLLYLLRSSSKGGKGENKEGKESS